MSGSRLPPTRRRTKRMENAHAHDPLWADVPKDTDQSMRGRTRADEWYGADSGFQGRPSGERASWRDIPPKGWKERVLMVCACKVSVGKREGGFHGLTG